MSSHAAHSAHARDNVQKPNESSQTCADSLEQPNSMDFPIDPTLSRTNLGADQGSGLHNVNGQIRDSRAQCQKCGPSSWEYIHALRLQQGNGHVEKAMQLLRSPLQVMSRWEANTTVRDSHQDRSVARHGQLGHHHRNLPRSAGFS